MTYLKWKLSTSDNFFKKKKKEKKTNCLFMVPIAISNLLAVGSIKYPVRLTFIGIEIIKNRTVYHFTLWPCHIFF